jgi:hypothetical protein
MHTQPSICAVVSPDANPTSAVLHDPITVEILTDVILSALSTNLVQERTVLKGCQKHMYRLNDAG